MSKDTFRVLSFIIWITVAILTLILKPMIVMLLSAAIINVVLAYYKWPEQLYKYRLRVNPRVILLFVEWAFLKGLLFQAIWNAYNVSGNVTQFHITLIVTTITLYILHTFVWQDRVWKHIGRTD